MSAGPTEQLAANAIPISAIIYQDDMYVDAALSLEMAALDLKSADVNGSFGNFSDPLQRPGWAILRAAEYDPMAAATISS